MSMQTVIFLVLGAVILALVVINAFLLLYFYRTNKKIDTLLEKGKIKDFKDILLSHNNKNNDLEEKINKAFLKIKAIENTCETTIQKIGVVRYNPFNKMGGNQSFVIAMLDNQDNGFIISSLFINDGSRVYTKTVKKGKADYSLSKEEVEAVNIAINSK